MKKIAVFLILFSLGQFCFAQEQNNTTSGGKLKWKPKTPEDVVQKANKQGPQLSTPFSSILNDPMVNSMMGGYSNMIRNGETSSYSLREQSKQQAEYATQE